MKMGSLLCSLARLLSSRQVNHRRKQKHRRNFLPFVQILEPHLALSGPAMAAPVTMISATTTDSRSVTITYRVDSPSGSSQPLQFGVYRSSDSQFSSGDSLVAAWTAGIGDPGSTTPGTHQLTIPLSGGLPLDPGKPYVLVVADPSSPLASTDLQQTASFRKYTIGIVTHGGFINTSWKHGPPWELQIGTILKQQGYDAVIPFNWTTDSSTPGRAATEGPRLARQILRAASQFPASAPIDLQFIGHSEGAVVNTQAIVALGKVMTPQLRAGFIEDTLLDPHAANNGMPAQFNVGGGLLGALARSLVSGYQSRAKDPPVFVPSIVDAAQVFYQHTPASHDHGVNQGIYNLWGQVPVPNRSDDPVAYYNLTAAGATHSGNYGVAEWYRNFVAPTLGNQAPLIAALRLNGQIVQAGLPTSVSSSAIAQRRIRAWGLSHLVQTPAPEFSGTAAPGSEIRVFLGPAAKPSKIGLAGRTTADASGSWSLTSRPLRDGRYRAVAMAFAPSLRTRPGLTIVPMAPLGQFQVELPS
jgi:hypothetical protein